MSVTTALFADVATPEPGQRLGISFTKAQLDEVEVRVGDKVLSLAQSSMGLTAISSCVWDCGLALVDYLQSSTGEALGLTMDIGCGTGVAGLAAVLLGAKFVCFTDTSSAEPLLSANLKQLQTQLSLSNDDDDGGGGGASPPWEFIEHDWVKGNSSDFLSRCSRYAPEQWDTLLLSDVLYEQASHAALMALLRSLRFGRALLAYKRRHDAPERAFLLELESWCELAVVPVTDFTFINATRAQLNSGLYIIVARPRL